MLAIAEEAGVEITIDDFDAISERTPLIGDLRPGGQYVALDWDRAGGTPLLAELLTGFRHQIVPAIARQVSQVGIKEIFHANWRHVLRSFPGMKIVLTARDPRDIYLSLRARYDSGAAIWKGEFSPARVAASLNEEFHYQLEMFRENTVFKARYEDLCLDTDLFRQVFEFVESDLTEVGKLGSLLTADDKRVAEGELHDGKVTDQRVARWKKEKSEKLLDESFQVLNAMPEFCEFWHYQR
jgi:hypothetical protein